VSESDRQARARERRQRISVVRGSDTDAAPIAGAEAFALAARMSREQWLLAGNELPTYSRADMPIVFIPSYS